MAKAGRKPTPTGFAETFIRWGWRGVEAAFGARTSNNRRWIDEQDNLIGQRRAYRNSLRAIRTGQ